MAANGEATAADDVTVASSVATPVKETPPVAAALATKSPDNVTKEELLDVLQKMNKKVKALSALRTSLTDRVKVAETDRERLVALVKHEILNDNVPIDAEKDEIEQLQVAWRAADEQNSLALQELQNEYKVIAMQCEAKVERIKEEAEAETKRLRREAQAESHMDGNEAWEVMREQMIAKHEADVEKVRQELAEDHAKEMASLREELRNLQQSESHSEGNGAQSGDLEARHAEEVKKVKIAAAAQLQEFKKKVAAARALEKEKLKKEMAAVCQRLNVRL